MLKRIFFALYLVLICELLMQLVALIGVIPGIYSKGHHLPYARVYWNKEGFSNDVMNRYGWYYHDFNRQSSGQHRIALVGDSYIDAIQVRKDQHLGVVLENRLQEAGKNSDVIAIGKSGVGPAYYLEMMKYAHKHFEPDAYIVFVFLGNDYRNASIEAEGRSPKEYIYYQIQGSSVELHPESTAAVKKFSEWMEKSHEPLYKNAVDIFKSYLFLPQVIRDLIRLVRERLGLYRNDTHNAEIDDDFHFGKGAFAFKTPASDDARDVYTINNEILKKCADFAASVGSDFQILTIPTFPDVFYLQQGLKWKNEFGDHDFFAPEKNLTEFSRSNGIRILPMGNYMSTHEVPVETIQQMYLLNGQGHFSAYGHKYFAERIAQDLITGDGDRSE